jgi:hypothetical protein
MRPFTKLTVLALALSLAACSRAVNMRSAESAGAESYERAVSQPQAAARPESESLEKVSAEAGSAGRLASYDGPTAAAGDPSLGSTVVLPERKIIRNAELTVELDAPAEAQRKLASLAESFGGYVVAAESQQRDARGQGAPPAVSVEMRVPAPRFDAAVAEIRALGGRVRQEKITGRDVTEEYIDLEARLRAQRALEAQFLEIMKRANQVSDALEVQRELANVRSEIERVEGRRRFLENQSSLSTIKVTLQPPAPLVGAQTSGFFANLRRAFGDGLDTAAAIVLGLVTFVVAAAPVAALFGVPTLLLWRFLRRRFPRRARPAGQTPPAAAATG